ncbi:MAG TPA: TIGR03435 family protein [Terriglobia bacterium]|jgi:uncharacterized protein (TIGR03435 family)
MKRAALTLILGIAIAAQAQNPSFEVASIKPNNSRAGGPEEIMLGCHGTDSHSQENIVPMGRCVVRHEPLRLVIALAYDVPPAFMIPYDGKILSGPDWINSDVYNFDAKAEGPATEAQLKLMLQTLLAERFNLKLHRETKELPVYALVTTRNPLKFQPAPKDRECEGQSRSDHRYELGSRNIAGQCHGFVPENGQMSGRSVDMSDVAEMLSRWAGRVVIDRTEIKGLFDVQLPRMASANVPLGGGGAGAREGAPGPAVEGRFSRDSIPTVFAAVEQFGLKLESSKGPVEVLVVDNIQKPTEN